MKLNVVTIALAASAFGALSANAQTTVIEERRAPGVVIEERRAPSVTIEHRDPSVRIEKRETFGSGDCSTKTVRKEGIDGSTTVKKTNCD